MIGRHLVCAHLSQLQVIHFANIIFRWENTYPGVRCDIPAHAYQSGFAPNSQWTEEFAQGHEIKEYWQGVAKKYDIYKYLKPNTKVEKAEWLPDEGKWKLTLRDLKEDRVGGILTYYCCWHPYLT
jgi:cation diffusion facilitator CzcD-associated flavoprotein CzcO